MPFSTFDQGNFRGFNNFPSREGSGSRGFNKFRGSSRRGCRGFNGGRNYWNFNKPQCQLCGRVGHLVQQWYYRFDPSFQGPSSFHNGFPYSQDSSQMIAMVATTPEFVYDLASTQILELQIISHQTFII